MPTNWQSQQARSTAAFARFVRPVLEEKLGGKIEIAEGDSSDHTGQMLDRAAGLDAYCHTRSGVIGIASRVQFMVWKKYTFTIRLWVPSGAPTEMFKRITAIRSGQHLRPDVTTHAYIIGGELEALGVVNSDKLYSLAGARLDAGTLDTKEAHDDGVVFGWIDFADAEADWYDPQRGWLKAADDPAAYWSRLRE